jgi:enoyl-CoA hydratase/carnithine racemase
MMHVRLAITPAWGGGQRLLRLAGFARTLEWLAGGKVFAAAEALAACLANRIAPKGEALAEARAMARLFAWHDSQAVRAIKRIVRAGASLPPAQAMRLERETFPDLWAAPRTWKPRRPSSQAGTTALVRRERLNARAPLVGC